MKLPDIGFVLLNIDNSPIYDKIFSTIKEFIDNNPYSQIVVFNSQCNKLNTNNIPILHLSHAKFFNGILFIFDAQSIIICKKFTNVYTKYFYAFDTPWNNSNKEYGYWRNLIGDKDLNIITANDNLDNIYNICWKETCGVAKEFDYNELFKIIQTTKS